MPLLGEEFPNFRASTTEGDIELHSWLGYSWGALFSHPADFTPVCTTELARLYKLAPEFERRDVKLLALSCDTLDNHRRWSDDVRAFAGDWSTTGRLPYPIIADCDRRIAALLGMLDLDERDERGVALTARAVFIIDPKKKFRLSLLYPATVGRNFDEVLRAIDALQTGDERKVATPADWRVGDECMVLPTVPDDDIGRLFPLGVVTVALPSERKYLRITPHQDKSDSK